MSRDLAVALALARKDALAELRGRVATGTTLFFGALVLLLFGFALGPDADRLRQAAPGLLWLAIVFAGLLAVGRLHESETEDGALEQLSLYPVGRHALYAGKALAGFVAMLVLGAVLLPVMALLYGVDLASALAPLALVLVLGAAGFAAVATCYAALTVRMRSRELLLPLLVLPVVAPLLLAAVKATAGALGGDPFGELGAWLALLAAFAVLMLVAGAATYRFALED
ncbi:MAG TPA: heme exporter protein CcmB [Chloroflexota bacterium]|nr:heme exporter protein CcmB [Candidatus Limnocylindria bacterium]HEU5317374.1 heme exporter protein CcmB [Chloroflexota bacterium]